MYRMTWPYTDGGSTIRLTKTAFEKEIQKSESPSACLITHGNGISIGGRHEKIGFI